MTRTTIALCLALAACGPAPRTYDSGIPDRDADRDRWELCEGCVMGCDSSDGFRCIPHDGMQAGCDLCFPFCGIPLDGLPAVSTCEDGVPYCGPGWDVTDVPSCYRDLAR
jgi:hypothetical protein